MAQQFTSVVEQATGRKVRTFLSESNVDNDIAVEVFLLGDARTDMAGVRGRLNSLGGRRVVSVGSHGNEL
jgi:hypothetical protein